MSDLDPIAAQSLARLLAWLDSPAYAEHLARILAEIAADPDAAVGHCGSYS